MFDVDKWLEIFSSIRRHKLRTFLTALSVFWGILMLIILVGAGSGLENSAEYNFQDDAVNSIWIFRGRTSMPYKGLPVGRSIQFDNEDYERVDNEIEEVDHLTARYYLSGDVIIGYKGKSLSYRVIGVHPDHQVLENTMMVRGRYINQRDIDEARKVCLIGDVVKNALFPDTSASIIGEPVTIGGIQYTVVGEYTDQRENETRIVYVPISTCQKIFTGSDRIHQLMMTVGDATFEESKVIEGSVRQLLADHHKFDIKDEQAIYINNDLENYREFRTVIGFIKGFIWFVGIGSIIAGVIGVSNIMLIIVKDRTREIGIRKAMGATPWSIVSMILQESIFITAIAGYIGLLVGFGIVYGINALMQKYNVEAEFFRDPQVNFGVVVLAMLILVISGALAGLLPALKAARINPVVAMKG
ncbi:MAG: ABC transporter permease [Saprospiraceae bacterium]|nr:ABC transporter permease [Saprospiraceae bacterium]